MADATEYCLGIVRFPTGALGHNGLSAGYATVMAHDPTTGETAEWIGAKDGIDWSRTERAVLELIAQP